MRACPLCRRLYRAAEAGYCQADGTALVAADAVPLQDPADPRVGALYRERYRIYRVVADGGMGRVYEALDGVERRAVAIKVLHRELQRDSVSVERFRREYAVGQSLHHPHIVHVLDFFPTEDQSHALVTEFLVGEELRGLLKREGGVSPGRVVRVLSQAALGLEAAHARGLVHRDLKPENIFLCRSAVGDDVKILDFGSVKDTESREQLTVMGTAIGSPFYMSPEQAQGLDSVDQRTDVWALSAITYEMLSGRVPFQGSNGAAILFEILTKPPPPLVLAAAAGVGLPEKVEGAIGKGLAKNPDERAASVTEIALTVGRAFGLDGAPEQWAVTSEAELSEAIVLPTDSPRSLGPERAFFGMGGGLSGAPGVVVKARGRWSGVPWLVFLGLALVVVLLAWVLLR